MKAREPEAKIKAYQTSVSRIASRSDRRMSSFIAARGIADLYQLALTRPRL
jgi:hypothetical protein